MILFHYFIIIIIIIVIVDRHRFRTAAPVYSVDFPNRFGSPAVKEGVSRQLLVPESTRWVHPSWFPGC